MDFDKAESDGGQDGGELPVPGQLHASLHEQVANRPAGGSDEVVEDHVDPQQLRDEEDSLDSDHRPRRKSLPRLTVKSYRHSRP